VYIQWNVKRLILKRQPILVAASFFFGIQRYGTQIKPVVQRSGGWQRGPMQPGVGWRFDVEVVHNDVTMHPPYTAWRLHVDQYWCCVGQAMCGSTNNPEQKAGQSCHVIAPSDSVPRLRRAAARPA